MNVTDYVKSSTNSACASVSDYNYKHAGGKESCYININTHNYLYSDNLPWTVSPFAGYDAFGVSYIWGDGYFSGQAPYYSDHGIRPAFYVSSETTLNGEGTETNPYTVSKYVEEVKEEQKDEENNKDEVKVDNGQIVEVPSTSAFGSIIIAGLGLTCVTGSVVVMRRTTRKKVK